MKSSAILDALRSFGDAGATTAELVARGFTAEPVRNRLRKAARAGLAVCVADFQGRKRYWHRDHAPEIRNGAIAARRWTPEQIAADIRAEAVEIGWIDIHAKTWLPGTE